MPRYQPFDVTRRVATAAAADADDQVACALHISLWAPRRWQCGFQETSKQMSLGKTSRLIGLAALTALALALPAKAETVLRVAMTAADIPATDGARLDQVERHLLDPERAFQAADLKRLVGSRLVRASGREN